jgi:hypothetical protein
MRTRLFVTGILLAFAAHVQGQTLGEAAQKEKERRAKQSGSAKSYTDSDLQDAASKRAKEGAASSSRSAPPSEAPTAASPSRDATASKESAAASEASKKSRADYYKGRLAEVNARLKAAEEELTGAEKQWRMVQSHPWEMASQFESAKWSFEAATKKVERLRREQNDLEDDARREGIPPGYLR